MLRWALQLKGVPYNGADVALTVRDKVYCFGGAVNIDVHVFNPVSLCWRKLTPVTCVIGGGRHLEVPPRCYAYTAVLIEDAVYIWGGYLGGEDYNVLYVYYVDAHRWFKPRVSGTIPEKRHGHSACVLEKAMFIHGGDTSLSGQTNDMHKLDTTTMVWSIINTRGTQQPPASFLHSAAIIGTKMFVFGGNEGVERGFYNDIRVFDTETDTWMNTPSTQQPLPEGRCGHSAFTYNGELFIFGGFERDEGFDDLWKFSPETFSWKKVEPKGKGPGPMVRLCCCMVGDRIIFFVKKTSETGPLMFSDELSILDLNPSLKALCKLAVIQYALDQSELPHDIRWELAAMPSDPDSRDIT